MTRLLPSLSVLACAALAVSCAPTSETAGADAAAAGDARQCFLPSLARNFRPDGPSRIYVRANDDRVYMLNTSGGCRDLDVTHSLSILPDGAGLAGSRVCTGDWVRVTTSGASVGPNSCRALVEKTLTAEEVAALPSAQRP
jgi:hypothetical protein